MQKIIFLSTLALLALRITHAEIKQDPAKAAIKKTVATPPPAPAPPPAPVNKTTSKESTPALVYTLTAARVKIRTGSDNKEFPSKIYACTTSYPLTKTQIKGEYFSFYSCYYNRKTF